MAAPWLTGIAAAFLAMAPAAALADPPLPAPPGPPPAVGRISHGVVLSRGEGVCSGTLVAPDLVLTAAHCVQNGDGKPLPPGSLRFSAGWPPFPARIDRVAREVILARPAPGGAAGLATDAALVVLSTPIPADRIAPVPLAARPGPTPHLLYGFRRDAPDAPPRGQRCRPVKFAVPLIALDCPAVSGNSGGPLLSGDGGLIAVMVAALTGPGPARSLALLPPADLAARIRRGP